MLYNAKSRRQFLAGAGPLVLALPALPSLMPRSAWSAPMRSPMRLVMSGSYFGQSFKYWTPKVFNALDTSNPGVRTAKLTDLLGPISKVLGPDFNGLKGKMNIVYGCSVLHNFYDHQGSGPVCSSASDPVAFKASGVRKPGSHQPSVQYILANSPKVYPDGAAGLVRFIGVSRGGIWDFDGTTDFTFDPNGKHMGVLDNAKALYQKFAGAFNPSLANANDPATQSRIRVIQDVRADYKSVLASGQLSAADRPRFEAYVSLIAEVEKSLSAPFRSCADPKATLAYETGATDRVSGDRDCAKILAAALACQLTSVVDFNVGTTTGLHNYQHSYIEDKHSDIMVPEAQSVAYLWGLLDAAKDADGRSVLDNSLAVFSNGDGMCGAMPLSTPISDTEFGYQRFGPHNMVNLPVATAGSLGGRLRTGYFLDYSLGSPKNAGYLALNKNTFFDTGRPYNNFLVTIFSAFGLGPSDYETVAGQGYGDYASGRISYIPPELTSTAGRRAPLPFLLKA